jgi:hypothetical protein
MTRETFSLLQREIYLKKRKRMKKIEILTTETLKNGGKSSRHLMRNTGFNKERWTTFF